MNKLNLRLKLLTWLARPVGRWTITSIAGGYSGVREGRRATPEDREATVMRSEHSRVGKSRFGEQQGRENKRNK